MQCQLLRAAYNRFLHLFIRYKGKNEYFMGNGSARGGRNILNRKSEVQTVNKISKFQLYHDQFRSIIPLLSCVSSKRVSF